MLWTIVLAVPTLWTVGLVSSTTLADLFPFLLVAAVFGMLGHAISLQHRPRGLRRPSRAGREREFARKEVLPMAKSPSRSFASRILGSDQVRVAALSLLAVALGCAGNSSSKRASIVSDSDFGRLSAGQSRPVEEARAQLGLAQDELGRAKLSVVNDRHEGELARSDQATASADASRAAAQSKIGKESNEPGQIQQAREDTTAAQSSQRVADARLAYSKKLATSQAAQVTAAERKVELMTEKVNLAKLQSLDDAAVPAAGKYDRATVMQQVVDAQRAYDRAITTAAAASLETTTAKESWLELERTQN